MVSSAVLRAFVQEVTGSKVVQGNRINVVIQEVDDYIATHKCPKDIVLSTLIDSYDNLRQGQRKRTITQH